MSLEARKRVARAVGFALASMPLCFGALRALTSGTDFRYLITALVSLAAAGFTFRLSAGKMRSSWGRTFLALAVSTLAGAMAAFGQGASSAAAVATVAGGFGICVTLGGMLGAFSRTT
jgi:hypothetical protein